MLLFCARATRGRGLPSLDARSGRSAPIPRERTSKLGRTMLVTRYGLACETARLGALGLGG